MAARPGCSSSVPSLPPPRPKSPPEYPDLYGKRREAAKVQMLEREIGFLEVGPPQLYEFLAWFLVFLFYFTFSVLLFRVSYGAWLTCCTWKMKKETENFFDFGKWICCLL